MGKQPTWNLTLTLIWMSIGFFSNWTGSSITSWSVLAVMNNQVVCLIRYMGPWHSSPYPGGSTTSPMRFIHVYDMQAWARYFLSFAFAFALRMWMHGEWACSHASKFWRQDEFLWIEVFTWRFFVNGVCVCVCVFLFFRIVHFRWGRTYALEIV